MQPVTADQRKEGREESAALRTSPDGDHASELPHLQYQERGPQHEGDESSQISYAISPRTNGQGHQSARVARSEKAAGFDRNAALVEQLHSTRTACSGVRGHRGSGKDRRI